MASGTAGPANRLGDNRRNRRNSVDFRSRQARASGSVRQETAMTWSSVSETESASETALTRSETASTRWSAFRAGESGRQMPAGRVTSQRIGCSGATGVGAGTAGVEPEPVEPVEPVALARAASAAVLGLRIGCRGGPAGAGGLPGFGGAVGAGSVPRAGSVDGVCSRARIASVDVNLILQIIPVSDRETGSNPDVALSM